MPSTDLPRAAVAPAAVPPEGPPLAAGETVRTVGLPGLSLVVRSRSDGGPEPALCVHGLGGSSQNWSALMARISDIVAPQAPDLPGFGHSPPPDNADYTIPGQARAVIRLLDAEGRGPVHLFGNSLGGSVAVKVAAARPDLVRTLTLISPALPEVPPQLTAWPTVFAGAPGVIQLYTRLTRDWSPQRRTHALLSLCYGDPDAVDPQAVEAAAAEYERRMRLPYFRDVMVRSVRGLVDAYTLGGQHALWRQAERVLAPTLLVHGGRDKLVSAKSARRAAGAFRDRRTLVIPGSGHVAMMEYPELVDRAFRDLLADVAAREREHAGPAGSGGPADSGTHPGASRSTGTSTDTGTDAATRS
ncbi:alpha/beta fold hydrolase [Streptomyces sp. CA2R106]|uniref:alpha/beta fold hydrolase n=1 Tax=Streptomyces sp. CA2R106 TaxID=3120153 RepID=UPI003007FC27